jgi:hypothetical protein
VPASPSVRREFVVSGVLTAAMCLAGMLFAQDRTWKEGVWTTAPDEHSYAIETDRDILVLTEQTPEAARSFAPIVGETVTYRTEKAPAVSVHDERTGDHTLQLVRQRPKYATDYPAAGSGHFIKAVGPGGASVVLEDGSRWDIDPLVRFSVADWETNEMISIRRSTDDPAFSYEIDNTSRDDGALANYRRN